MLLFILISLLISTGAQASTNALPQKVLVEDTYLPWKMKLDRHSIDRLQERDVLVIKGNNPNDQSQLLVIRIDDRNSYDYYSRTNLERRINSGTFELRISAQGLKKENKQPLDIEKLKYIYIFNGQKTVRGNKQRNIKDIKIDYVTVEQDRQLPDYVRAYDFGSRHSEILEGTTAVNLKLNKQANKQENKQANDAIQLFGQMSEIDRPGPDPWMRDGIAGIEELRMPLAKGLWRIILFREDLGEWENLPRQMNLGIALNGIKQPYLNAENNRQTPAQWFQQEYLRFYRQTADRDPWLDIVSHRGLVQSYDFEQATEELSIQLLGDSPQQRFISGLILQKLDDKVYQPETNALTLVNERRQEYFRQHWMVENQPLKATVELQQTIRLAQGEGKLIELDIQLDHAAQPSWQSSFKEQGGYIEIRKVLPRWRRSGSTQHLTKRYTHLTKLTSDETLIGAHRVAIWLKADEQQAAGNYEVVLSFNQPEHEKVRGKVREEIREIKLTVNVIDQILPMNKQKVGIYLDHSPHLQFFKQWQSLQLAQVYCDLNYLDRLGLRALAPPMETPSQDNIQDWLHELALYKEFYGSADLLAYTPYKRLKDVLDTDALQARMEKLAALSHGEINLYWSIADEALLDQIAMIEEDAERLHSANQYAKTAGHLNNKNQKALIKELDLVLINHGFGVDKGEISRIHKTLASKGLLEKKVWLYNMPDFRLAAGAFLWHSEADGYVQWHGRMPTANPYDPTDGREGDYQFFYPQPNSCAVLPDVDRGLFELAMGQYELRWYLWLDQQTSQAAIKLKQQIASSLGQNWQQAEKTTISQLEVWRGNIIDLAQSLKHPDKSMQSGGENEQVANAYQNDSAQDNDDCNVNRNHERGYGRVRNNRQQRCE